MTEPAWYYRLEAAILRVPAWTVIYCDLRDPEPCPDPYKRSFATGVEAADAFRDLMATDPFLKVYPCRCRRWHVGHPPPPRIARGSSRPRRHLGQRVARALDPHALEALVRLRDELGGA